MFYQKKDFCNKFKPVFREMEYVRVKVQQKQGLWIFKRHLYTVDELMTSPHFCKIDSILGKIGDDVSNWEKQRELSFFDKQIYGENRERVEEELHKLKKEIYERKPTWWENFRNALDEFIEVVMSKLPYFQTFSWSGLIGGVIQKSLSGKNKNLSLPQRTR